VSGFRTLGEPIFSDVVVAISMNESSKGSIAKQSTITTYPSKGKFEIRHDQQAYELK
jgi:hypothetical protein